MRLVPSPQQWDFHSAGMTISSHFRLVQRPRDPHRVGATTKDLTFQVFLHVGAVLRRVGHLEDGAKSFRAHWVVLFPLPPFLSFLLGH
jgi:hypothetical protein